MANSTKYFIGNWKMFGIPSSFKIIERIQSYFSADKRNNSKYKIIIAPPFNLLQDFSKRLKKRGVLISAQNCFHKDNFGAYTGNISPFMIKKMGINYTIIGHSENRALGENEKNLEEKVYNALKNKLNIIFCIGENMREKKNNKTMIVLKSQISKVLKKKYNFKKILIAYEPIWSIGSGKVPSDKELKKILIFLKKFVKRKFRVRYNPKIIYGGSVDKKNINNFKSINELDGFLIGGASKSSKNFIDILREFYK